MIWRNMDGIEDFYRYRYEGLRKIDTYRRLDGSLAYFTQESLRDDTTGDKSIVVDGKKYVVPDYYDDEDIRNDLEGNEDADQWIMEFVREDTLHYFAPEESDLKPVVVNHIDKVLAYGIRECDSLDDYDENPRTEDHYPYNRHKYPDAELVPVDEITPGKTRDGLNEARIHNVKQGIKKGYDLPPIVIDKKGTIRDGNHRYYSSRDKGYKTIPVVHSS